jgi:hypothetical protein
MLVSQSAVNAGEFLIDFGVSGRRRKGSAQKFDFRYEPCGTNAAIRGPLRCSALARKMCYFFLQEQTLEGG